MLSMIRNMLRTKLAGLLFILIIVAMGAWGVTDVFSGGIGNNLASAGDVELTEAQFDQEVERQLRTATDDRGRAISKAQATERGIIDQIFQRELFQTTLVAYADRIGARATNEAVLETIRSDEAFQTDTGSFDPALYRGLLNQSGFTPASFENFLRRDLSISRIRRSVGAALQSPDAIVRLQSGYANEERQAQWFFLTFDDLPEPEPITDEELTAFYDERRDELENPQRRRISLLQLSVDDFLNQSEFTEDELVAYYESVKSREYAGPDTRTWTEFVFASEEDARAQLGRIAGGADPSTITNLVSSSERSGLQSSVSNQSLADRLFAPTASIGGIFGPFESGRFYTVARLQEITPGEVEPFEDVRQEIVDTLSREQAVGLYYDSITRLDNLIGTGASLEEIGQDMGTPVLSFAPVERSGATRVGRQLSALQQDPAILQRAFELTEGGKTSRFGQDESAFIVRVDEIIEPFTPDLDEIRDDLRTGLEAQRRTTALSEAADEIKQRVEDGELTFAEAAAEYGAELSAPDILFTRNPSPESGIPPALAGAVFSLREEGNVVNAPLSTGDTVALIQLVEIDRVDLASDEAAMTASQELTDSIGNDLFSAFIAGIQDDVELQVNQNALASYKARVNPDP
jgi:peptidyl-prolyl cis-trans isomerase D